MNIEKNWKSIGVISFVMILGILASCSRQLATVPTVPFTPTNTPTVTKTFTPTGPTNTFTNTATPTNTSTPCGYPGNTCTFTLTPTITDTPTGPTATPTATPANAIPFENFTDSGYPANGAPWAGSPEPAYLTNNYQAAGTAVTFNLDATTYVSSPNSMKMQIGFSGPSTLAQAGFTSGYASNNYGGPISIEATSSAHPSKLSLWIKFDQSATIEFLIHDNLGNQSYFANNAAGAYQYPITGGVWTNVILPLDATGDWDANFPFLDWTQILFIGGVVVQPGAATNMQVNWDDIYFYP